MKDIYNFDIIIVGAGVIGIAIASVCAQKKKSVLLIEKNPNFGEGISSRNSEVIHAGIYYPENSLKAQLCRDGMERLYRYCYEKKISIKDFKKEIINYVNQNFEGNENFKKIVETSSFCSEDNNIISDNYKIIKDQKIGIIPPIGGG